MFLMDHSSKITATTMMASHHMTSSSTHESAIIAGIRDGEGFFRVSRRPPGGDWRTVPAVAVTKPREACEPHLR